MSDERSPALIAAIVALVGLSVAGWLVLRAFETDEANDSAVQLAETKAEVVEAEIQATLSVVDGIGTTLGESSDVSQALLASLAARSGVTANGSSISELAAVQLDGDQFVVRAAVGAVDPDALVDQAIDRSANLDELFERTAADGLLAIAPAEVLATIEQVFETSITDVLLITPVGAGGDQFLLAQYDVDGDLPEGDAEFVLRLDNSDVFASSGVVGGTVMPFASFDAAQSQWEVLVGPTTGEPVHRGSWILLVAGALAAAGIASVSGVVQLSKARAERLAQIEFDARHDPLTGLTNRKGLTDELELCLQDRRNNNLVGVLLLDLDRLKVVNDSIGHSAGDEVLAAVADRLRQAVREGDTVGRFGGDEFIVVSSGVPAIRDLTLLADRILEALREPAVLSDESSQMISASIGIAYVAGGEGDAESLLRDADVAMYKAKEAGGGRYVVFDAELREQAVARLEVERELRRAIRTGQLHVHYQPIVDAQTGGVDRLEALVRWEHPVRGMMPPGAFLSVAAESGLIVDVGEHVLRESCRQAASWTAAVGHPVMVSVNVAERQLIDTGLLDLVRRVLAETGLDPAQLELELSEEIIVERLDTRLTILRELVDLGVKLAIDDFGTSRASLSQLKRLDMVSTLKIDRAFVVDVANEAVDRKIVTAIVALAHSMGMETVAEGVEEAAQIAILRSLGINLFQGFYFHRPAPGPKVAAALTKPFEVPEAADQYV